VLNYQTAVVRKDFDTANAILPSIPKGEHNAVAVFLEAQGFKEEALSVSQVRISISLRLNGLFSILMTSY